MQLVLRALRRAPAFVVLGLVALGFLLAILSTAELAHLGPRSVTPPSAPSAPSRLDPAVTTTGPEPMPTLELQPRPQVAET